MNEPLERIRFTGEEQAELEELFVAFTIAEKSKLLKNRASKLPRGKCTVGIMKWALQKIIEDLLLTMPGHQLISFKINAPRLRYSLGVKNIAQDDLKNYGLYMSYHDIGELILAAQDHCMLCDHDPKTIKNCKLRKAIDTTKGATLCNMDSELRHYI